MTLTLYVLHLEAVCSHFISLIMFMGKVKSTSKLSIEIQGKIVKYNANTSHLKIRTELIYIEHEFC